MVSRRGFLGMLGAVTTTAYFLAPVGGWTSSLIINPNDLSAPTIHKANAVYGRYNWMALDYEAIPKPDPLYPKFAYEIGIRPYKRSEVLNRPMSTLPNWTSGTAHLISV